MIDTDLPAINAKIAEMEGISRQREFTDVEIDEFVDLANRWRALDRQHKRHRAAMMKKINGFLTNVWRGV